MATLWMLKWLKGRMMATEQRDSWRAQQMRATEALKALRAAGEETMVGRNALREAVCAIEDAVASDDRPVKWRRER